MLWWRCWRTSSRFPVLLLVLLAWSRRLDQSLEQLTSLGLVRFGHPPRLFCTVQHTSCTIERTELRMGREMNSWECAIHRHGQLATMDSIGSTVVT